MGLRGPPSPRLPRLASSARPPRVLACLESSPRVLASSPRLESSPRLFLGEARSREHHHFSRLSGADTTKKVPATLTLKAIPNEIRVKNSPPLFRTPIRPESRSGISCKLTRSRIDPKIPLEIVGFRGILGFHGFGLEIPNYGRKADLGFHASGPELGSILRSHWRS